MPVRYPTPPTDWTPACPYLRSVFLRKGTVLSVRDKIGASYDFEPISLHLCPTQAKTPQVVALAEAAYTLLLGFINGTSNLYPPAYLLQSSTSLCLGTSDETLTWLLDHVDVLTAAGNSTVAMQSVADSFCAHFGVARMHAAQFYDRLPGGRGEVASSIMFQHPWSSPGSTQRFACAFLLLLDMINHPPLSSNPDDQFTLRTLDITDLCIHLNMARSVIEGDLHKTHTYRLKLLDEINTYNLPADRKALLHHFCAKRFSKYRTESKIAAGGRLALPFLAMDSVVFDHVPMQRRAGRQLSDLLTNQWHIVTLTPAAPLPFSSDFDSKPPALVEAVKTEAAGTLSQATSHQRFEAILQSPLSLAPGCAIVIRGQRLGDIGTSPIRVGCDIAQAMTPHFDASCNRFTRVALTRIAYRDLAQGLVELVFVFASATHASVAWHMSPLWLAALEIASPQLVLTSDLDGDRHPLCQLSFTARNWPKNPMLFEWQRPFGHPALPAPASSARILALTNPTQRKIVTTSNGTPRRVPEHAKLRVSYDNPIAAAKLVHRRVLLFAKGSLPYKSEFYSSEGRPHISTPPVSVCDRCHHIGHSSDQCNEPLPAPQPATAQGCNTCALVDDWDSCGRVPCQLASDFDRNAVAMAKAAEAVSTSFGFFSPSASSLRAAFTSSAFCT